MSNDRELLEMAAKAAGIEIMFWSGRDIGAESPVVKPHGLAWNPLTDDGDALRLAVKLCIRIEQTDNYAVTWGGTVCAKQFSERINDDRYAATRRAIVRAAAEIGRSMP
jgi:hypothetical protein